MQRYAARCCLMRNGPFFWRLPLTLAVRLVDIFVPWGGGGEEPRGSAPGRCGGYPG